MKKKILLLSVFTFIIFAPSILPTKTYAAPAIKKGEMSTSYCPEHKFWKQHCGSGGRACFELLCCK